MAEKKESIGSPDIEAGKSGKNLPATLAAAALTAIALAAIFQDSVSRVFSNSTPVATSTTARSSSNLEQLEVDLAALRKEECEIWKRGMNAESVKIPSDYKPGTPEYEAYMKYVDARTFNVEEDRRRFNENCLQEESK